MDKNNSLLYCCCVCNYLIFRNGRNAVYQCVRLDDMWVVSLYYGLVQYVYLQGGVHLLKIRSISIASCRVMEAVFSGI